jgi:hypothetical protein
MILNTKILSKKYNEILSNQAKEIRRILNSTDMSITEQSLALETLKNNSALEYTKWLINELKKLGIDFKDVEDNFTFTNVNANQAEQIR